MFIVRNLKLKKTIFFKKVKINRKCQYLYGLGHKPEDIIDLIFESSGQHLVSLIQNKQLDVSGVYNQVYLFKQVFNMQKTLSSVYF